MLTSTRFQVAYPQPDRSDSADAPRDFGAMVAGLEKAAIYLQGTIAARPAAAIQGRYYFATDTGQFSYDSGSAWSEVGSVHTGNVSLMGATSQLLVPSQNAASNSWMVSKLSTDTQYRFTLWTDGTHNWGPGSTTPIDTQMTRTSTGGLRFSGLTSGGVVQTPHTFIGGNYAAGNNWLSGGIGSGIYFDGTNWQNKSDGSGSNGWFFMGSRGDNGGIDFYTTASSGAADRTYTPAQFVSTRAMWLLSNGQLVTIAGFLYNPPTASGSVLSSTVQGEANQRFTIDVNGSHQWGAGAASAPDTTLARTAAGTLDLGTSTQTSRLNLHGAATDTVVFGATVAAEANQRLAMQANGDLVWGPGSAVGDVRISRVGVGILQCPSTFQADLKTYAASVTTARAGGAAAALPANPVRYLAMQDENGNRMYVPAYS